MSLAIDTNDVKEVLLVDGWHKIKDKSFDLDAYEFMYKEKMIHGGGASGVCATGFIFIEEQTSMLISGPLTSIIAVRYSQKKK